jgi:hypothetical protein
MKHAVKLIYANGGYAYLDVKGRYKWKTKRTAKKHLDVCQQLLAKNRFLTGVVKVELDKGYFV